MQFSKGMMFISTSTTIGAQDIVLIFQGHMSNGNLNLISQSVIGNSIYNSVNDFFPNCDDIIVLMIFFTKSDIKIYHVYNMYFLKWSLLMYMVNTISFGTYKHRAIAKCLNHEKSM